MVLSFNPKGIHVGSSAEGLHHTGGSCCHIHCVLTRTDSKVNKSLVSNPELKPKFSKFRSKTELINWVNETFSIVNFCPRI